MAMVVNVTMVFDHMDEWLTKAAAEMHEAVQEGAAMVNERAAEHMHEPKSGIHWPGLPNRSSAPGEAPAIQSGRLKGSLANAYQSAFVAIAGTDVDYGLWLELGTHVAARPFMQPGAIETFEPWIDLVKDRLGGIKV